MAGMGWTRLKLVSTSQQDDGTGKWTCTIYYCERELESETGRPEDDEFSITLDTLRDESHSRWPGEVCHDEDEKRTGERPLEPWGVPVEP